MDGVKVAVERCRGSKKPPPDSHYSFATFEGAREPQALEAMKLLSEGNALRVALLPAGNLPAPGCGKTHLLRAAMARLQAELEWCVLIDGNWSGVNYKSLQRCDALFVDHLGRETQAEAQHVANTLCKLLDERKLITCVASSMPLMQLRARYGPELESRLRGMQRPILIGADYRAAGMKLGADPP